MTVGKIGIEAAVLNHRDGQELGQLHNRGAGVTLTDLRPHYHHRRFRGQQDPGHAFDLLRIGA